MRTLIKLLVAGVMIALAGAVIIATPQEEADQARAAALRAFEERIGEYAALHRQLKEPLPQLKPYTSPRAVLLYRTYLRTAIKTARPNARQGDIFTPSVARLFRDLITKALAGQDAQAMLRDLFEEQPTEYAFHPRVYEQYPDWATHEMPLILLLRLPPLPDDIEYRLVDHDLVVWDIDADLIVDVLPGAFSRPTT